MNLPEVLAEFVKRDPGRWVLIARRYFLDSIEIDPSRSNNDQAVGPLLTWLDSVGVLPMLRKCNAQPDDEEEPRWEWQVMCAKPSAIDLSIATTSSPDQCTALLLAILEAYERGWIVPVPGEDSK